MANPIQFICNTGIENGIANSDDHSTNDVGVDVGSDEDVLAEKRR